MKKLTFIIPLISFLCGCGGTAPDNSESNEAITEIEEIDAPKEDIIEIDYEGVSSFLCYVEINRYEPSEQDNFNLQTYDDLFYYYYPQEADFKRTEKTDHITYFSSITDQGSQYVLNIDDYSESTTEVNVDAGFTKWVHDTFVNLNDPVIVHEKELNYMEGVVGYYSVYTYTKDGEEFTTDYAHFGFDKYIVGLSVTATPYGESFKAVNDYIGLFQLVEALE